MLPEDMFARCGLTIGAFTIKFLPEADYSLAEAETLVVFCFVVICRWFCDYRIQESEQVVVRSNVFG